MSVREMAECIGLKNPQIVRLLRYARFLVFCYPWAAKYQKGNAANTGRRLPMHTHCNSFGARSRCTHWQPLRPRCVPVLSRSSHRRTCSHARRVQFLTKGVLTGGSEKFFRSSSGRNLCSEGWKRPRLCAGTLHPRSSPRPAVSPPPARLRQRSLSVPLVQPELTPRIYPPISP
jgi:hypothetical protein